jgi:ketosteroid isomerase-like protein
MTSGNAANDAERAVLAAAQRWLAATMSGDADALDQLLADGYTYTHATTGVADTREVWLESFRTGGRRYQVYEIADLSLRTFPGTVVMTGRAHQEMSPRGEQVELNTSFTSVWVEQAGGWRLAAWQATRFLDDQQRR